MHERVGFEKMDKLTEIHTIRITSQLKTGQKKLTLEQSAAMNEELRIVMAKHIHMSNFDPKVYLGEDE